MDVARNDVHISKNCRDQVIDVIGEVLRKTQRLLSVAASARFPPLAANESCKNFPQILPEPDAVPLSVMSYPIAALV